MVLIIDNYDSFSYNLYQAVGEFMQDIQVIQNDTLTIEEINKLQPSHIILSPGPGTPQKAGVCVELVQKLYKHYPMLGVCLGHQAICHAFGASIGHAKTILHGKQSCISLQESKLFCGLGKKISVARYHSLAAQKETMPGILNITASADDGEIMAVEHEIYPVYGVQFHPESILTKDGKTMIHNFLKETKYD